MLKVLDYITKQQDIDDLSFFINIEEIVANIKILTCCEKSRRASMASIKGKKYQRKQLGGNHDWEPEIDTNPLLKLS